MSTVLERVGAHGLIENPFASSTKGQMFTYCSSLIGEKAASAYLSATHSCSLTGQRNFGVNPAVACGVCFGCVVRRASFKAAGLTDQTQYIDATADARLADWLQRRSVETPMRNLVRREVKMRDILAMGLPPSFPLDDALDLCRRGLAELGDLFA